MSNFGLFFGVCLPLGGCQLTASSNPTQTITGLTLLSSFQGAGVAIRECNLRRTNWIGGDSWRTSDAFGGIKTANIGLRGNALNHFLELPKERLDEFLADPEAYYRKYILMSQYQDATGKVTEEVPAKVIALWGLSD